MTSWRSSSDDESSRDLSISSQHEDWWLTLIVRREYFGLSAAHVILRLPSLIVRPICLRISSLLFEKSVITREYDNQNIEEIITLYSTAESNFVDKSRSDSECPYSFDCQGVKYIHHVLSDQCILQQETDFNGDFKMENFIIVEWH